MYKTLIILIILCSCFKVEKKETIQEFVLFGYSGFQFKDSVNWIFDSTKLEIRQYFEFKADSFIKIAKGRNSKLIKYYSVNSVDTANCYTILNSLLLSENIKTDYYSSDPEIYDGLSYSMYYKTSKNKEHFINFVPHYLPNNLNTIHEFIEKVILSKDLIATKNSELHQITEIVAKENFQKHAPQSKPIIEKIKFIVPRITEL